MEDKHGLVSFALLLILLSSLYHNATYASHYLHNWHMVKENQYSIRLTPSKKD